MKGFVRKYKREVIVGVVVALITAAIIKLGDWIITVTPAFGQTLVSTMQNIIYMTAATQTATTVDRLLFGSLYSAKSLSVLFFLLLIAPRKAPSRALRRNGQKLNLVSLYYKFPQITTIYRQKMASAYSLFKNTLTPFY